MPMPSEDKIETRWRLTHIGADGSVYDTLQVDSFADVNPVVKNPRDHFEIRAQILADAPPTVVGVQENRHENGRYDILIEGHNGFLKLHSYITAEKVRTHGDETGDTDQ
jgi:hypothetical protein